MPKNINTLIINWYNDNKRALPWRNTCNPYFVWLSEIILQQTRVAQGLNYYKKFVANFPTISDLALADEQDILKNWQGLGYYSRARNLHKTAKIIHHELNGEFPNNYKDIISLPGIGDYTASAISSFSFDEAQAVLDGNVFRVLSRLYNISIPIDTTTGKKEFRSLAQEFLDKNRPAIHNQAIMEFGALQCTPKSPNCDICPILLHCEGYKKKNHLNLPIKSKKTKVRNRHLVFFFGGKDDTFLVQKRTEKDIWQHLFQFPVLDDTKIPTDDYKIEFETRLQTEIDGFKFHSKTTHLLSHQKLQIEFYTGALKNKAFTEYQLITKSETDNFPFPRPLEEFLNNLV